MNGFKAHREMKAELESLLFAIIRLSDIEVKVRRVRTPEGARRFGQPIGSVITSDIDLAVTPPARKSLFPTFSFKTSNNGGVETTTCTDKKSGRTATVTAEGGYVELVITDSNGKVIKPPTSRDTGGISVSQFSRSSDRLPDTSDNRAFLTRRANFLLKLPYIEEATKKAKESKKRKTQGVVDNWWGVYGVDWQNDDEGEPIIDVNDPEQRLALAKVVADDLGIKYVHEEGTTREIHFETIETINTLLSSLDGAVPGIAAYAPIYGMDTTSRGLAWCTPVSRYQATSTIPGRAGSDNFFYGDGYDYPHAAIGLSHAMFSDSWDVGRVKQIHWSAKGSSWWSVDPNELEKQTGWEDWQALIVSTLTHEIGHMVGYVGIGELGSVRDESRRQEISDKFKTGLSEIFSDFGLLLPDEELTSTDYNSFVSRDRDLKKKRFGHAQVDRYSLAMVLSEYGSVNLHELFAESWAEYMLAERPRPFAQAVGELLESSFKEFADYEYGEID